MAILSIFPCLLMYLFKVYLKADALASAGTADLPLAPASAEFREYPIEDDMGPWCPAWRRYT